MNRQVHIIYVPGIQDDVHHAQGLATKLWRLYGVHGHCHEMPWAGTEAYAPKHRRLLDRINKYADRGHRVYLVGASAGASAVLNAYVELPSKVKGVALICAKINYPETVSNKTYRENPAFKTALYQLQKTMVKLSSADKSKIVSFYSTNDQIVPYEATTVPGIAEKRLPPIRHGYAIFYSLTLGARGLIKSLKMLSASDS